MSITRFYPTLQGSRDSIPRKNELIVSLSQTVCEQAHTIKKLQQALNRRAHADEPSQMSVRRTRSFLQFLPSKLRLMIFGEVAKYYSVEDACAKHKWSSLMHCPRVLVVSRQFVREFGYAFYRTRPMDFRLTFAGNFWPRPKVPALRSFLNLAGGHMLTNSRRLRFFMGLGDPADWKRFLSKLFRELDRASARPTQRYAVSSIEVPSVKLTDDEQEGHLQDGTHGRVAIHIIDITVRVVHSNNTVPPFTISMIGRVVKWRARLRGYDITQRFEIRRIRAQIVESFPKLFNGQPSRTSRQFWTLTHDGMVDTPGDFLARASPYGLV